MEAAGCILRIASAVVKPVKHFGLSWMKRFEVSKLRSVDVDDDQVVGMDV